MKKMLSKMSNKMLNNMSSNITDFDEAVRAGYKIHAPNRQTDQEKGLCQRLGDGYHPARLYCWNIAHRVVGDGWSEAVYPTANSRDYYVVELWSGYCTDCVARVHGLEFKDVKRVLNLLERKYVDPVLSDDIMDPSVADDDIMDPGTPAYGTSDVSEADMDPAMNPAVNPAMDPVWTVSVPGYHA